MDKQQGARETSQAVRMFSFSGIFAQLTKFKVSLLSRFRPVPVSSWPENGLRAKCSARRWGFCFSPATLAR
jgi:hypothetical protein